MAKVSFIGLGVMGYPMAGHLAAEGHEVCVYNRSLGKAQSWVARFAGEFAATPREAAVMGVPEGAPERVQPAHGGYRS